MPPSAVAELWVVSRCYARPVKKAAFIILGAIVVSISGCLFLRSPNRYEKLSEAEIHAELIKDLPLGSSSERVRSYLRRKTGRDPHYARDFNTVEGKAIIRDGKILNLRYYAGAVHAKLANYGPPLSSVFTHGPTVLLVSTNVQTRWEFDARDRLIDLQVTKQPFGP